MPGILARIKFLFTGRLPAPASKVDAAQTSDENRRHWANADALSADSAYDPGTRWRLRNRSRYEALNNCYAKGAVRSSADDLVGKGPRLQLHIPGDRDDTWSRSIERSYHAWSELSLLPIRLRTAEKARVRDGECFGIFDTNTRLDHPVKFDVRWVEAEMCGDPFNAGLDPFRIDGIKFDERGNPVAYTFFKRHPGDVGGWASLRPLETYTVQARNVIHWFALDRFGQHRAIPETTPALPLYAQVRRYTLATLTAAEFAAMLAGIMKTSAAPEDGGVAEVKNWQMFELVRGALLTLPQGWEATQFKAEQPHTRYGEFKHEVLNESGRATNQPLNVVTGNSSGYNFSSGRLDHLPYHRGLDIGRHDLKLVALDRIFRDGWYPEAVLVGVVPREAPPIAEWTWCWNWDGFDSIDPVKDAMAADVRLKNATSTYAEEYAAYGQDWREQFQQMAREKELAEKLGLPWPLPSASKEGAGRPAADPPAREGKEDDEEEEDGEPTRNGQGNGFHSGGRS